MSIQLSSVTITDITSTNAYINWTISNPQVELSNYTLIIEVYLITGNLLINTYNVNGNINFININNLIPNSSYYCIITLNGSSGMITRTTTDQFSTSVQGSITNVTIETSTITTTSMLIKWNYTNYPLNTNVLITTNPPTINTYSVVQAGDNGVTITNLSPGTTYNVNVNALYYTSNLVLSNSGIYIQGLQPTSNYITRLTINNTIFAPSIIYNSRIFTELPLGIINTLQTCNITWGSVQVYWSYSNYPQSCNVTITLSNTTQTPSQVSNIPNIPLSNSTIIFSNMSNASNYTVTAQVLDQWYSNYTITTPVFSNLPHGIINTLQTCNITWGSVQVYWSYSNYPQSCNVTITLSNTSYNSYTLSQVSNIQTPLSNNTVTFSNMSNASNYTVTAQVLDQWYSNYTVITPVFSNLPHGIINTLQTCNITWGSVQVYWSYSNYPQTCNVSITLSNTTQIPSQVSNIQTPLSNSTIIFSNMSNASNYTITAQVLDQWYSNYTITTPIFSNLAHGIINSLQTSNITWTSVQVYWTYSNYPGACNTTISLLSNNSTILSCNIPLSNKTITFSNINSSSNYIINLSVNDTWYSNLSSNTQIFTALQKGSINILSTCNITYNSAIVYWLYNNYPPDTQVILDVLSPYGSCNTSVTATTLTS